MRVPIKPTVDELGYRWRIRRARTAAGRAVGDADLERAGDRIGATFPRLAPTECRQLAEEALRRHAFLELAEPALLRLSAVRLCRELRFEDSWTSLAGALPPRALLLPDLGSPALARRVAENHLPVPAPAPPGGPPAPRVLDLRLTAGATIRTRIGIEPASLSPHSAPPGASLYLLTALPEPEAGVRVGVESVPDPEHLATALQRLLDREAAHYDWLSAPSR